MTDAHCHLNFQAFEKDLDEVIQRAKDAGVNRIINVGSSLEASKKAVELAQKDEGLFATVGIHPHHADKLEQNWEKDLETLAKKPKVVAIGETGMDYFSYESNGVTDKKLQEDLFEKQIQLASKLGLPLMLHNRQAGNDMLEILSRNKSDFLNPPGLFHCFSGDVEFLKKVLDLGFYVGFDGNITYKGIAKGETTSLIDLVKYAPLEKIITETDAPYLAPIPHRGERNEPSYVIIVAEFIAQIKGISTQEVIEKTTLNANTVFRLSL
jgi:TatD DNase family protein